MRNPFKRRCCEVPFVFGHLDKPGGIVSGIAQVGDSSIHFIGVVMGGDDFELPEEALDAAHEVLRQSLEE